MRFWTLGFNWIYHNNGSEFLAMSSQAELNSKSDVDNTGMQKGGLTAQQPLYLSTLWKSTMLGDKINVS